jgi:hypothetical protein
VAVVLEAVAAVHAHEHGAGRLALLGVGSAHPGDRDGDVRLGQPDGAARHLLRALGRDDALRLHAEHEPLGLGAVGHDAPGEPLGARFPGRERGRDRPRRHRLGRGDDEAAGERVLGDPLREPDLLLVGAGVIVGHG